MSTVQEVRQSNFRTIEFQTKSKTYIVSKQKLKKLLNSINDYIILADFHVSDSQSVTRDELTTTTTMTNVNGICSLEVSLSVDDEIVFVFGATPQHFFTQSGDTYNTAVSIAGLAFADGMEKSFQEILECYRLMLKYTYLSKVKNTMYANSGMVYFESVLDTGYAILDFHKEVTIPESDILDLFNKSKKKFEQCADIKSVKENGIRHKIYSSKKKNLKASIVVVRCETANLLNYMDEEMIMLELYSEGQIIFSMEKNFKKRTRVFNNLINEEDRVEIPEKIKALYNYLDMVMQLAPGMHFI